MTKQIKRKIYLLSKKPMKPIEVVQFETGVQLVFEVQDIELDETATATLFVRKPSGKFVFQEDNVSLTGNTVVIDLHNQAIAEYGKPFFQIKFKKGEEVISTFSGMLTVEKSLDDSGAEESKTVIAAFDEFTDEQISRIEEATRSQIDLMKAEVEAKGETVLATIPDEYTEMYNRVNTLFNSVANAIKGTVSGSVVRVDDVSPVEHSVKALVRGKNLFDISKVSVMLPSLSAYVSEVGENYIVVTTPEGYVSNGYCTISRPLKEFCPALKIGKTYILNAITQSNSNNIYLPKVGKSWVFGTTMEMTEDILNSSVTFYGLSAQHGQGVGNCTISNIQIEEGTTATEYTPYINPTDIVLTKCGKNLVEVTGKTETIGGVTFTVNEDGSITVNGTAETNVFYKVGKITLANSGRFFLSGSVPNSSVITYMLYLHDVESYVDFYDYGTGKAFTPTGGTCDAVIAVYKGATANNLKFYPMVEAGEEKTPFIKFEQRATYTPNTDGTVEGIASLTPTMTLLTDTEGVTIECEYTKDTNKVIEKLTNAVAALGGAV